VSKGEKLVVFSAADMPDWVVRERRQTGIIILDIVWRLADKRPFGRKGMRYLLEPWPEIVHHLPGRIIRYDADYVRRRDEKIRSRRKLIWLAPILPLFKPIIGLLPSEVKMWIECRFGISARSATFFSLWIELSLFFLFGVLQWVTLYTGLQTMAESQTFAPVARGGVIAAILILAADMAMRYDSYIAEHPSPYGLFEWLFRRLSR
jgi:hypothetical protein